MRKVFLLAALQGALLPALAHAESVSVASHSLMRLPSNSSTLSLERLDVADYGTLLIPARLIELQVGELTLGHEARITIVPGDRELQVQARAAQLAEGSQIVARGAPGTYQKAALPGRDLRLRIESLQAAQLYVDARGGAGTPGYAGLDGARGEAPGCAWGAAGRGANGDNGGDGHPGGAGAQVRLQLPASYPAEQVKVLVQGGPGGAAGTPGKPGAGGKAKGCVVYRTEGGKPGREGLPGQAGTPGADGSVSVQRF